MTCWGFELTQESRILAKGVEFGREKRSQVMSFFNKEVSFVI